MPEKYSEVVLEIANTIQQQQYILLYLDNFNYICL